MKSSILYTMGMALDRAAENGLPVEVLVSGSWMSGQVAACDGIGVVLETPEGHHVVAKFDYIAAVKVLSESPYQNSIGSGSVDPFRSGSAVPMPGRQESHVA